MKVYFERTGGGCGMEIISIYVKPHEDGSAVNYNKDGSEYRYRFASPEMAALCVDSSELPRDLWFSFRHGMNKANVPWEKRSNFTLDDLIYDKVDREEVKAYVKVMRLLDGVNTIDEFKSLCPLIKRSGSISRKVIRKLFDLCGMTEHIPINGETGLAFLGDYFTFRALARQNGFEEEIFGKE